MRKFISIILILCIVFLSACTLPGAYWEQGEIPDSTEGKDLTLGDAADNVFSLNCNRKYSFNPLIATNHSNQLVCSLVYENMVEIDNNFEPIPNLVTEWKHSDDSTVWTLTIAEGRTFHDGSPVTAKDLRYSLDRAINSDRFLGRFRYYGGCAPNGDNELQIMLSVGDSQFIKLLNIPVIKYGTYDDKYPEGSGPYAYEFETTVVATPNPDKKDDQGKIEQTAVALKAYEDHPDYKTVPVDTIYLQEYTKAEDIINAFEDSYIDVVINDPSSYTNLGYATINEIHTYATTNMHYIGFNEESVIGVLPGFRYALQYAFDREYLIDLLHGYAVDSAVPMYPTCKDFPQSLNDSLHYDIERCRTILENNGFSDVDEDGWLEYLGAEVEISFILCSDSSAKAGIANRFAQDMSTIGLKINVQELTWTEYYNALTDYEDLTKEQKEDENFHPIEWDMYYGEVKVRNTFDISEMLAERKDENKGSNMNYSHSKDNGYQTLLYNYLASSDATREANYRTFAEYVLTNRASLVIIGFEKQQLITHRAAIRGVDPNYGNPLYDFANWKIQFKDTETDTTDQEAEK